MRSPESGPIDQESELPRKDELRGWLKEAMPSRTLILQDPGQSLGRSVEAYEVLDIGLDSIGSIVSKGARFEKGEFLQAIVRLLAKQKGIELGQVKSLERVKREALPLVLEMTEEVYLALLSQGMQFEGHKMVTSGDFWLNLRPEENDRIRFVQNERGEVDMIVEENSTVGKGQIILYPIEEGELMTENKRVLSHLEP